MRARLCVCAQRVVESLRAPFPLTAGCTASCSSAVSRSRPPRVRLWRVLRNARHSRACCSGHTQSLFRLGAFGRRRGPLGPPDQPSSRLRVRAVCGRGGGRPSGLRRAPPAISSAGAPGACLLSPRHPPPPRARRPWTHATHALTEVHVIDGRQARERGARALGQP